MTFFEQLQEDILAGKDRIYCRDFPSDHDLTYGDLAVAANSIRSQYLGTFSASDVVALAIASPTLLISTLLACWQSGYLPAVLPPDIRSDAFGRVDEVINSALLLTDTQDSDSAAIGQVVDSDPARILSQKDLESQPVACIADGEPAVLMFTSGTTSTPKCIPWSFQQIRANLGSFNRFLGIPAESVYLCTSPPWYSHGLYNSFLTALFTRGTVLYPGVLSVFNAESALKYAGEFGAAVYHTTPSMLRILNKIAPRAESRLPAFQHLICGTAGLPEPVKRESERIFGVEVVEQYGMVETLYMTVNYGQDSDGFCGVGKSIAGGLAVVDEGGVAVPPMVVGEIRKRVTDELGYYRQDAETAASYRDGWFYTGDVGYFDQQGRLTITSRRKAMIKRQDVSIDPMEIQNILEHFTGIEEVAVVGVPDEVYGELIGVAYTATGPIDESEIRDWSREHLPRTHLPDLFVPLKSMPKTAIGKVSLTSLRQIVTDRKRPTC